MIHRNVRSSLIKLADRISTGLHHVRDQAVGHSDRASRIVYEAGLHFSPADIKAGSIRRRKWANLELFTPLLAKFQHTFSLARIAFLAQHSVVLRPKMLPELPA